MLTLNTSTRLFTTPEMLQLVFFFFYMGMQLTFWSGEQKKLLLLKDKQEKD